MSFDRAKSALAGTRFSDLRSVADTGSTNADMRSILTEQPGPWRPIVLLADHQSAGRGRLDRNWDAPPGTSILMSIGCPMDRIRAEGHTLLTMCVSLAVTDAIAELEIPGVSIKWPNDIVVVDDEAHLGYRKLGGVLAELVTSPKSGTYAILGLGLNVNWREMPLELADIATSLMVLTGTQTDRDRLVELILGSLHSRWLPLIESSGDLRELVEVYSTRCATIGRSVRIELVDGTVQGVAEGISDDGALVLRTPEGSRRITAGDVIHLRPGR